MKRFGLQVAAAAMVLGGLAAAPAASAFGVDAEERGLYDLSIKCMAFYGVMANPKDGKAEDEEAAQKGALFMAVATGLADNDEKLVEADFTKVMEDFATKSANGGAPGFEEEITTLISDCTQAETIIRDAMKE